MLQCGDLMILSGPLKLHREEQEVYLCCGETLYLFKRKYFKGDIFWGWRVSGEQRKHL